MIRTHAGAGAEGAGGIEPVRALHRPLASVARRWAARPRLHRWLGGLSPEASGLIARRLVMWPRPGPAAPWETAALAGARRVELRSGQPALQWGEAGPVVLAMHGWEGRPSQFAALLPGLLAAGRRVVAPYGPAHAPGAGGDANVLQFARALVAAAAGLPELESVVGHSMGGAAALLAVRAGMPVRRVATLAAPSALAASLGRTARGLGLTAPAYRAFRRLVDAQIGTPARQIDVAPLVAGLSLPVLLVHDADDAVVPPSEARRLAGALPGAALLETHGLRHSRVLYDRTVVGAVVDFLAPRA